MKKFTLAIAAIFMLTALGCGTRAQMSKIIKDEKANLDQMENAGAKLCAPREFAAAEAHLDFAQQEWRVQNYRTAEDHIRMARNAMKKATPFLGSCREMTPADADNDKIPDMYDRCPKTPGFAQYYGCPPLDSDGDGVLDPQDECPNEPGPPENKGCPKKYENIEVTDKEIKLKHMIFFDTAKTTIKPESLPILDEIADVLTTHSTWTIRIEGHTDNHGGHAYNMNLSQGRADSCKDYLVSKDIDASRLDAIGYGPDKPVATNQTEFGRSKNRRVEFHIVSK